MVTTDQSEDARVSSIALQDDGKILAVGFVVDDGSSQQDEDGLVARYLPDGKLDATFGTDGIAALSTNGGLLDDVVVQPDGKIVVAGNSSAAFFVARLRPDGTLDPTFGSDGRVEVAPFDGCSAGGEAVALQTDGKVLVVGNTCEEPGQPSDVMAVTRLASDGSVDSSFGQDGWMTLDFGHEHALATDVIVRDDGRPVLAGYTRDTSTDREWFALAGLLADGQLDSTFGQDGKVTTEIGDRASIESLALDRDGAILAAGGMRRPGSPKLSDAFAIAKYEPNGQLDTTFGNGGIVTTTPPETDFALAHALTIQADGKVVAAGRAATQTASGFTNYFTLVRYLADGRIDGDFGSSGLVMDLGQDWAEARDIALQEDGRIVVGGAVKYDYEFALARYLPGDVKPLGVRRLAGRERFETAARVVLARFESADTVYLATGLNFPDALAAGPLAARNGAPVVLTAPDALPQATADALNTLNPNRVIALGGSAAIHDEVLDAAARAAGNANQGRLHGSDRFETAAAIAEEFSEAASVYLATGNNFPDALAGGPAVDGPILLATSDNLPEATAATLERLRPERAVALGGPAVISDKVLASAAQAAGGAQDMRISGADRYETASAVAQLVSDPSTVYVATGINFPDALAGGPAAATEGAPIVLTHPDGLPDATRQYLTGLGDLRCIVILGGSNAVSSSTAVQLSNIADDC